MTQVTEDKSGPVMGYRIVSIILTALFLLQAVLAGRFVGGPTEINTDETAFDIHSALGDLLILVALILTVLAFLSRRTFGIGLTMHCAAITVLTLIQVILGRSGSDELVYHVPLGVLLFGMACAAAMLGFFDLRSQRRLM